MAALFWGKKNRMFGKNIEPACRYCENGFPTIEGDMIKCGYKGIISPDYSCRKFEYAPLKRVPKRRAPLPEYSAEDFEL